MSLVKCEHCHDRVPARGLPLHLKHCVNYRRKLKAGTLIDETELTGSTKLKSKTKSTKLKSKG